ncbi:hypothetical protein VT06_16295 [Arsukibacterium sp. MJ3]|nr:hypothetical protein VT06_16295 [Arsukibacterium sp. MJ3]
MLFKKAQWVKWWCQQGDMLVDDFSPSDLKSIQHSKRANMYYLETSTAFLSLYVLQLKTVHKILFAF